MPSAKGTCSSRLIVKRKSSIVRQRAGWQAAEERVSDSLIGFMAEVQPI